jgi:hypothetical protein
MRSRLFSVLAALLFVAGTAAAAVAAGPWSQCANGPSEDLSCRSHDRSIQSSSTDLNTVGVIGPLSSMLNSAQVIGPRETGAMPNQGLTTNERGALSGGHVRDFDPSKAYPARLWNANAWPTPNLQDGP